MYAVTGKSGPKVKSATTKYLYIVKYSGKNKYTKHNPTKEKIKTGIKLPKMEINKMPSYREELRLKYFE